MNAMFEQMLADVSNAAQFLRKASDQAVATREWPSPCDLADLVAVLELPAGEVQRLTSAVYSALAVVPAAAMPRGLAVAVAHLDQAAAKAGPVVEHLSAAASRLAETRRAEW